MRITQGNVAFVGNDYIQLPVSPSQVKGFFTNNGTLNAYDTFMLISGTQYQVPVGKKLVVFAVRATSGSGSTDGYWTVGYADTAVTNSTSAPTNPKSYGGDGFPLLDQTASGGRNGEYHLYAEIPAGKYPYIKITNAVIGQFHIMAAEVDA